MIYHANFKTYHHTRLVQDITDTNKNRLAKSIEDIANSNRQDGETLHWWVNDRHGICHIAGFTTVDGTKGKITKGELWTFDEPKCKTCAWYHANDPDYPDGCEYPDNPPCNDYPYHRAK